MGFDQINFKSGAYYSRKLDRRGIQIDLLFLREDYRLVICEVKYSAPLSASGIFLKHQENGNILKELHKNEFSKYSVEYALIVGEEIIDDSKYRNHFDHVVDLNKILTA